MAVFKTAAEAVKYAEDHMVVQYATNSDCYKSGYNITPKGSVNHSIGVAQPNSSVIFNLMNRSGAGWGVNAILGDFHQGEGKIILCMPMQRRPWGVASGPNGSWNNSRIQWEVCEPAGHTYAGGTMINYDVSKNTTYFNRMWKLLVAWNVYCCVKLGYGASTIADHAESYKQGYGSNHSDMGQWLPKHGKSMDALRKEVREILNDEGDEEVTQAEFDKMFETHMAALATNNSGTWSKAAREWAVNSGICQGNGNGVYDWPAYVTREQMAQFLYNLNEKVIKKLPVAPEVDKDAIAKDVIKTIAETLQEA